MTGGFATLLCVLLALALDRVLGEPSRAHPLVLFGTLSRRVEAVFRRGARARGRLRLRGCIAWSVLVVPPGLFLAWLGSCLPGALHLVLATGVLYLCVGYRSLQEHCRAIAKPLAAGDEPGARAALAMIVSRDTAALDSEAVARGTLESLLENGSDAVVAPLFWFVVAGAPGALCYRLVNTLDAMWGYRNATYREFGWWAARTDDLLNLLPARLCALAYALAGRTRAALRCWSAQARRHDSPNAGPVIAAGAGALGIQLGGPACYGGQPRWRPQFGVGRGPEPHDIERGLSLLARALLILLLLYSGAVALW